MRRSSEGFSSQIVPLVRDLISIPSVTGYKAAMHAVLGRATAELSGFAHERFVEPNSGSESLLFFNTSSRPSEFRLLLNGHLDVVSGNPSQFNPYIDKGRLFGRGSYDMKGSAAVELLVFRELAKSLPYPIGLQLVTDEETGGFNGTAYQIAQGVRSNMVISGESTELDINNERKGVLVLDVTTHGRSAHATYLHQGENAAVKMARFVGDVANAYPVSSDEKWETTLNVAGIYTPNTEHNKVPAVAHAVFDIRHVPQETKDEIRKKISGIAPVGTEVVFGEGGGVASYADPKHPDLALLASCIESVVGKPANFVRKSGSSDSRHFSEIGSTSIDFGPSGKGLHTDEEYAIIESYEQYARILKKFIEQLK